MRLFQAFDNSFLLSVLLFTCQIIVVRASSSTGATIASTTRPTQTSDATFEQAWKSSPLKRGTADLLRSCFATIGLALWSSVILNVQMTQGDTLDHITQLAFNEDTRENKQKQPLLKYLGYYSFKEWWITTKAQFESGLLVRWKYKLLWAALNLVVPELAFLIAINEYSAAQDLLRVLANDSEIMKWRGIFSRWDLSMGFYAVAGGFYVPETKPAPRGYYVPEIESVPRGLVERCCEVTRMRMEYLAWVREERKRGYKTEFDGPYKPKRVLTARGVVYIANLVDRLKKCTESGIGSYCGSPQCRCIDEAERLQAQFADISPQVLADLSKADWLARILFFMQAIWMIVQSFARRSSKLHLTLLELQAAAHVGLASARYFFWSYKPIDIVLMTPLSLTEAQYKTMLEEEESIKNVSIADRESSRDFNSSPGLASNMLTGTQTERTTETLKGWAMESQMELITEMQGETCNDLSNMERSYFTSQATLGKSMYKQATGDISLLKSPFKALLRALVTFTLDDHSWRWLFVQYAWGSGCILYNGIYLIAWHWYFPTPFEQIAWRACTVFITGSFWVLTIGVFCGHIFSGAMRAIRVTSHETRLAKGGLQLGTITFGVLVVPWMVAKLFIFFEALISLRKLPQDTYVVISWASFLPHL